jgi:hypothetical protein
VLSVKAEACTDLRALLASFGEHMSNVDGTDMPVPFHEATPQELTGTPVCFLASIMVIVLTHPKSPTTRKRALTNSSALFDVLNEFVSTERSYVKRLRILKEVRINLKSGIRLTRFLVVCGPIAHFCPHQRHSTSPSIRGQHIVWKCR